MTALMRACLKKRPRGIFTYIGQRYDDGRKDLRMSLHEQFLEAVENINAAIFDNGLKNQAHHGDAMNFHSKEQGLVYIDPPYYSPFSDNEYVRRYHFLEGLARDWQGVEIQEHTITKKFKSYPTPFTSRKGAADAFDLLFRRFKDSILIVSYSSNSQPTLDEMVAIIAKHKSKVEVVPVDYKYSFGNQGHKVGNNNNSVKEYLFVGF
jgi:DNA adenine methylase